jgi:hypothetical protein
MNKKMIIFIIATVFAAEYSFAQIPGADKLKKKAEDKIEKKAEDKVKEVADGDKKQSSSSTTTPATTTTTPATTSSTSSTSTASKRAPFVPGVTDQPMTDYHKQHAGEIIFFSPTKTQQTDNYPISGTAFRPTSEKKEFKFRDALYACFYMPHCLENIPTYKNGDSLAMRMTNSAEDYRVLIFVDGVAQAQPLVKTKMDGNMHPNVFTMGFTLLLQDVPEGVEASTQPDPDWNVILNGMTDGKHKIKVELWGWDGNNYRTLLPVCSGEFMLTKEGDKFGNPEDDRKKYEWQKTVQEFNAGNIKDEGMTSDAHTKNVGKVVFSKSEIAEKNENQSAFTTSFSGADLLYARCYLAKSLWNTPQYEKVSEYTRGDTAYITRTPKRNEQSSFTVELLVDGKKPFDIPEVANSYFGRNEMLYTSTQTDYNKEKYKTKTTFGLFIKTSQKEMDAGIGGVDWAVLVNALSAGVHTITMSVYGGSSVPVCTGEFKYTKIAGLFVNTGIDYNMVIKNNPAGMNNPAYETQMKALVMQHEQVKSVVKLIITDTDWNIVKNEDTGAILYRQLNGICIVKDEFGYTSWNFVSVKEDWEGNKYQTTMYGGLVGFSLAYVNGDTIK